MKGYVSRIWSFMKRKKMKWKPSCWFTATFISRAKNLPIKWRAFEKIILLISLLLLNVGYLLYIYISPNVWHWHLPYPFLYKMFPFLKSLPFFSDILLSYISFSSLSASYKENWNLKEEQDVTLPNSIHFTKSHFVICFDFLVVDLWDEVVIFIFYFDFLDLCFVLDVYIRFGVRGIQLAVKWNYPSAHVHIRANSASYRRTKSALHRRQIK